MYLVNLQVVDLVEYEKRARLETPKKPPKISLNFPEFKKKKKNYVKWCANFGVTILVSHKFRCL